jgi:hypothetical protein
VKETATQDYHVTQRHTAEEWKDNQTISSWIKIKVHFF